MFFFLNLCERFKGVTLKIPTFSIMKSKHSVENCHFGKSFFFSFFFKTESCLFVVYSFHSPQVLLEFCGIMQLSAVSFFSEFSRVLWSVVFQLGIL